MTEFSLYQISIPKRSSRQARIALVALSLIGLTGSHGDEPEVSPQGVNGETFAALKSHSPFRRTVDFSGSLILTGIAKIQDEVVATLFDTETTEFHLVSKEANPDGWQLVGVRGDPADLESLTAKIQVEGGELISIRYEKLPAKTSKGKPGSRPGVGSTRLSSSQFKEAKDAAINYKAGFSSDGYPREPPSEIVKKLSRISVQQRENLNREMIELRNRGLGMEERRRIYVDKLDRSLEGRR